jgi:carboxyl-terminal processing protease
MMRKYLLIGASAFVLGAGSMAYVSQAASAKPTTSREGYRMMQLFGDVVDIAKKSYVTEPDEKKMVEAAINGMMESLDPHSAYLDASGYGDLRDQTRGAYGGLGLEVTQKDGVVQVISPIDDTPAFKAGIKAGDYITAIDGETVVGLPLNDAVKHMRGAPNTPITLTIAREGEDQKEVKLTREVIKSVSAKGRLEGDYAYLRLSAFNENTTNEAMGVVRDLKAKNPNIKGWVLDLRDNPGGLLDQAVSISDMFLDGGEVVTQRGRNPRDIERYNARPGDVTGGKPMVVLINSGTASASEIVAGALQDRKRAEVVGLISFGKGSVQSVIPLHDGADGALKLTTGRYYTPSGRSIQKTGIKPDLEVAVNADQAEKIANGGAQFTEATYVNALNADEGKTREGAHVIAESPPKEFEAKIDFREIKGDFQLQRALDVLRNGGVANTPKLPGPRPKLAEITGAKPPAPANSNTKPAPPTVAKAQPK